MSRAEPQVGLPPSLSTTRASTGSGSELLVVREVPYAGLSSRASVVGDAAHADLFDSRSRAIPSDEIQA